MLLNRRGRLGWSSAAHPWLLRDRFRFRRQEMHMGGPSSHQRWFRQCWEPSHPGCHLQQVWSESGRFVKARGHTRSSGGLHNPCSSDFRPRHRSRCARSSGVLISRRCDIPRAFRCVCGLLLPLEKIVRCTAVPTVRAQSITYKSLANHSTAPSST